MSQTTPTRILRIITHLHISGPALQVVLLTSRLNVLGYDGQLVTGKPLDDEDSMLDIAHKYDVQPLVLSGLDRSANPLVVWRGFWQLFRLIRQTQPHVVHTHTTTAGFLGRIAARLAGVPAVVHTMHFHPFRGYYSRVHTFFFILVERLGAYFSDSIVTLSEGLRKELIDTYHITGKNRMTILPLGFDLATFAGTQRHQGVFRQQWGIVEDAPLIGIIGRLLPVKNHTLFLDMAALLRQQFPHARFVIVGDGDERANLEHKVSELGLSDAVIFTGWQQQVETVTSDLDVLVISSHNEGTPVPIIEALAAGCPVVATDVGGIRDLLDGGQLGELVPSGNARLLCEAVTRTLENPPDPEQAQQTMLQRYGIDRLAQDMDSLYRGLLAKKGRRSH